MLEVGIKLRPKIGLTARCHQEVNTDAETFTGNPHQELEELRFIDLFLHGLIAVQQDNDGRLFLTASLTVELQCTNAVVGQELLTPVELSLHDAYKLGNLLRLIEKQGIGHLR